MENNRHQALVATFASLIALTAFIIFSISAPSSSISVSPIITITARQDWKLLNPLGPSLFITIQAPEQSQPITNVNATLEFSSVLVNLLNGTVTKNEYTDILEYPSVTKANPLLPSDSVSLKITPDGYLSMEDSVTISGTYADGSAFRVKTFVNWIN
jgi:hypothetical protein